jgi:hypothetical protein
VPRFFKNKSDNPQIFLGAAVFFGKTKINNIFLRDHLYILIEPCAIALCCPFLMCSLYFFSRSQGLGASAPL